MTSIEKHRLFVGCPLEPAAVEVLSTWAKKELNPLGMRLVPIESLHVTLLFFGEVDSETRDALVDLVAQAKWPAIELDCSLIKLVGHGSVVVNLMASREAADAFYIAMGSMRAVESSRPREERDQVLAGYAAKFAVWDKIIALLPEVEAQRHDRERHRCFGWPRFPLHVTLARTREKLPAEAPKVGPKLAVRLDRVALFESELHPEGATYKMLASGPSSG